MRYPHTANVNLKVQRFVKDAEKIITRYSLMLVDTKKVLINI